MATILWEHEIDKTVDWGGDISTGGAPVLESMYSNL